MGDDEPIHFHPVSSFCLLANSPSDSSYFAILPWMTGFLLSAPPLFLLDVLFYRLSLFYPATTIIISPEKNVL